MRQSTIVAAIHRRPVRESDRNDLFRIYASTREDEKQQLSWPPEVWEAFLRQQFAAQHAQYMSGYASPSFELILMGDTPIGRLYVDRQSREIRLIDIALLPGHRGQGIGGQLLRELLAEARSSNRFLGLHVERDNPILAFYRRLGLQVAVDRGVYLYMTTGQGAATSPPTFCSPALADRETFAAWLESDFFLHLPGPGTTATLRLERVTDLDQASNNGFSLIFSGPATLPAAHDTYEVSHPALGCFPLFLGPVHGHRTGEMRYQAIVSRLKTT